MTEKFFILKSQAPDDFEDQVKAYIKALLDHRFTKNVAAPTAGPLVTAAVKRIQYDLKEGKADDFVSNYEIIDDTPPPPTLTERKQSLMNAVQHKEGELLESINPVGLQRLNGIKWGDILKKYAGQDNPKYTPEEQAFLAENEERNARLDVIMRDVANIFAEIHGLDETTIENWSPPAPYK